VCVIYICVCDILLLSGRVWAREERRGKEKKSIVLASHPIRMHISIVCMYVYVSMHTAQAQRQ
jgi:hypothetical protein